MPDRHAGLYQLEVAQHPAARAWARISVGLSNLRAVVPVERRQVSLRKSSVYRLEGVGESGAAVIAKKCRRQYGLLERTIYELVLPNLSVSYPRFLGMAGDDDEISCWLFIEDAGNEAYSPLHSTHRTMAGRWLGALHASTTSLPSDLPLPDRGPVHYLRHLRSARDTIRENLNNPALDWEHAGRGIPAVDLAQAAFSSTTFLANPDLDAYWATVQWTRLGFEAVQRLAVYGTVFRCLAALHWESLRLAYESVEWPVKNMTLYEAELAKAVQAAGWRK